MKKFLNIAKWLVLVGVPILYYGLKLQQNIIVDLMWVYAFAMISKDFVMKIILKERYCETECKKR